MYFTGDNINFYLLIITTHYSSLLSFLHAYILHLTCLCVTFFNVYISYIVLSIHTYFAMDIHTYNAYEVGYKNSRSDSVTIKILPIALLKHIHLQNKILAQHTFAISCKCHQSTSGIHFQQYPLIQLTMYI